MNEDTYDQSVADELRRLAHSVGAGDSAVGLLILGLIDKYETLPYGPRALPFSRLAAKLKNDAPRK